MLDTDTSSYVMKGNAPKIDAHLRELDVLQVCISAITRGSCVLGFGDCEGRPGSRQPGAFPKRNLYVTLG
jgi:hypothetical protein